jgi:hypothetical protein
MKQIYNKEDMTFEDDEIGLKDYVLDTNKIKITLRVKTTKLLSNFKFEGYRIHFDYFISSQEGVIEKPFILLDYDPKLIPNAKLIQSEQDFFVVNDSTVIGIIPTILTSQEYLFSFYVDLKDKPDDDLWLNLKKPLVYVKNKELCTSVKCDDFDACTSDSCSNGKCAHLNICEQEKPSVGSYILYYIIGALLLMVLVAAYLLKKH